MTTTEAIVASSPGPTAAGATFYREADADPDALAGQRVAVIGYGLLGASMALNLRDSGVDVLVGNLDDSYRPRGLAAGFAVVGIAEAVAEADVVYLLIADEAIPECFAQEVVPALRPGSAVCFASGYCLAYGLVSAPEGVDVLLLAPRMMGEEVHAVVADGRGFVSYVSVERDATGTALARLLGLALAAGSLRRGALVLSALQEATLDLMVEQTVGPYVGIALQLAFALGVEAGLPPEALVLELYMSGEMSQVFSSFARDGFYRSVTAHGLVAQYGGFLRSLTVDAPAMREAFERALADIRSGGFAAKLQAEKSNGYPTLSALDAITAGTDPMSQAEARVRVALAG
ncbi:MAG: NAD(P)-binding domain-containing protein [Acidimicrobiales bacterium]